jgi:hypothetical protein
MRYATIEPYHVSVLRIGVRDLGGAEQSRRRCTGSTFRRILISPTSCRHLTLAVAFHGAPRGVGASGCSVHPRAYK